MGLKKNLDLVLYDKIKGRLIGGKYMPGQQVSIDELTEYYGVSRTPVVQALKRLEDEKILVAAQNGRIMVPEYSNKDIEDICSARILLETHAVEVICREQKHEVVKRLWKLQKEFEVYDRNKEYELSCKTDLELHKVLVAGANNPILNDLYSVVQGRFLVVSYLNITDGLRNQERTITQHNELIQSLEAFDAKRAIDILDVHVEGINIEILNARLAQQHA